jgi:hypothetical protein
MARYLRSKNQIEDDRGQRHGVLATRRVSRLRYWITGRSFTAFDPRDGKTPLETSVGLGRRVLAQSSRGKGLDRVFDSLAASFFLILALLLFGVGVIAVVSADEWSLAMSVFGMSFIFLMLMSACVVQQQHRFLREKELLETLPSACLICRYDLAGLAPEADGCTVCPECGASWRFPIRGPWGEEEKEGSNEPRP